MKLKVPEPHCTEGSLDKVLLKSNKQLRILKSTVNHVEVEFSHDATKECTCQLGSKTATHAYFVKCKFAAAPVRMELYEVRPKKENKALQPSPTFSKEAL